MRYIYRSLTDKPRGPGHLVEGGSGVLEQAVRRVHLHDLSLSQHHHPVTRLFE